MKEKKKLILVIVALVIIVIGAIVVGLKGFNVTLYLREHDTLEYVFDTAYVESDVESIAKEVFGDKDFETRPVEVFDDAVYIIAEEITETEEVTLLEKLSALYVEDEESTEAIDETSTEETSTTDETSSEEIATTEETTETAEATDETSDTSEEIIDSEEETSSILSELVEGTDYEFFHESKIRLRDLLKPYILPTAISAVIILICMIVRYRILKSEKVLLKTIQIVAQSILVLLVLLSLVAILRIKISVWIMPVMMFCVLVYLVLTFEYEIRRKDEKTN